MCESYRERSAALHRRTMVLHGANGKRLKMRPKGAVCLRNAIKTLNSLAKLWWLLRFHSKPYIFTLSHIALKRGTHARDITGASLFSCTFASSYFSNYNVCQLKCNGKHIRCGVGVRWTDNEIAGFAIQTTIKCNECGARRYYMRKF